MDINRIAGIATIFIIILLTYEPAPGVTFNSSDVPKAIPDNSFTTSTLTVPGGACSSINDINVAITVTHPFVSDLAIRLTHVNSGATAVLFIDSCTNNNDLHVVFDDQAAARIPFDQCPPAGGIFQPEEALTPFSGKNAAGTWTITVADQIPLDSGTLENWGISLSCGGAAQVTVAASGSGTVVSSPTGIDCSSGICSGTFASGQAVDLVASPVSGATFLSHMGGWSGACDTLTDNTCSFTMSGERLILATFITNPPVNVPTDGFYPSLQDAYDAQVSPSFSILSQAVELPSFDLNKATGAGINLHGGYNSAYSGNTGGFTTITGVLTVTYGSATLENIIIK